MWYTCAFVNPPTVITHDLGPLGALRIFLSGLYGESIGTLLGSSQKSVIWLAGECLLSQRCAQIFSGNLERSKFGNNSQYVFSRVPLSGHLSIDLGHKATHVPAPIIL